MGKIALIAVAAIAIAVAGYAPALGGEVTLTLPQFQARVRQEIAKKFPRARITTLGDHQLKVQMPGQQAGVVNLDRTYAVYEGTPDELETIVGNSASSLDALTRPASLETLVVIVRPKEFTLPQSNAGQAALARLVAPGLYAVVALDRPDSYSVPQASKLRADLKIDDSAIWTRALANTRAHWSTPGILPSKGVSEIAHIDGLASSLLIDDTFWDALATRDHDPVVVAVFTRDNLMLAHLSDLDSVDRLRKLMAAVRDDPNGLTNDLIVRRSGRWELLR